LPSYDTQDPEYRRLKYIRYADEFCVRPEVACDEWSKEAPSLVSRAVSNPSLRHWQRWGGKRGVTSKEASSRKRQPGKGKTRRMNANEPLMRLRDVAVIAMAEAMMNGTMVPVGCEITGKDTPLQK